MGVRFGKHPLGRIVWILAVLVVASCADGSSADDTIAPTTIATTITTTEPAPTTELPLSTSEPTTAPTDVLGGCSPIDTGDGALWVVVNDGVMGGRSSGTLEPGPGPSGVIFAGEIVTDGGGFSSIRLELEPDAVVEAESIAVRVRSDGRRYTLTADDALEGRDRRLSHWGDLTVSDDVDADGWAVARTAFGDLTPRLFGQPTEAESFQPALAVEIGIILADGVDGPFRLEILDVHAC